MSNDGGGAGPRGRLVGGRYRLVERIGSGGMGTVWRALDELVEREVAVKQPRLPGDPEDVGHQRAANRLYREARAAARVDHPSAVSIHDVVVEDGLPWIVMELIRGESLHEMLQRGPLEPAESARVGLAVLGALRAAHAVGIVHRDVKPANVLLGPHRRVVLTDFGIAHVQGEESLTLSGEFVGSLEFIAPERMSGRGAGPASDLWSLGVLLYAAVEGWSPFRRTTLESTLAAILSTDPPEPKQAGPLGSLIVRMLVKEPEQRPEPDEVGKVLEAAAGRWPTADASEAPVTEAQDASELQEFADDVGTVRLGGEAPVPVPAKAPDATPEPAPQEPQPDAEEPRPTPDSTPTPETAPTPETTSASHSRRPALLRHPLPAALLGALLAGGIWLGTSLVDDNDGGAAAGGTPSAPGVEQSSPTSAPWTAYPEEEMSAVLSVPTGYDEYARQGNAGNQPRIVIYADDSETVQIRLTQWDKAPRSPMGQAQEAHAGWDSYKGDARTQYTRTTVDGHEAVLADTTYDLKEYPTRVMELMILTDDSRMYELRVDMPKGTADEKKGTAAFKGARDRLEIGTN
ncbi:serine/threonine-protein kinase [Streptomyces sp. GESEQ-35]|uniref:serine/threonine-protein kinase n=1 Tax=Streptomyces sp. GESEQ-35 TaxID=2812657 RepID=UPI001B3217A8|nr:serine/threonine-protein kinase [Streptomyces sp. GESEQ-35]